ncbi:hypothetical protein P168DRAFT_258432 [Aspergillus campestris IBT 28561]|uniref:Ricin B lectin domain-containing protein n=1 Tax=Aspergillus campestris (strain IBT 28561) TaxID=1392248 RepID=A0A2I1CVM6_ASPC2|nr:uncharacterized protein P168DRAFT_258432 [Aspergillus campestris IBT 28561]PKY01683.1 hypothetical protein P168DRAFT_258432 [Aspergillus campestris IBT 28561]
MDNSSTSSGESGITPTHTSLLEPYTDPEPPPYPAPAAVAPHKGATFIIRDPASSLVITLKDGKVGLAPANKESAWIYSDDGLGSHWRCVENKDRWLGFYNAVSGGFLGHDNSKEWRFIAKAETHRQWEFFCVRQHPDGGHELLVKHWGGFRAMQVGGDMGRDLVVAGEGDSGTAWEFLEVYSEI